MTIIVPKQISITEKDWETGKEDSKALYGHINFSGYVSYLIREENKRRLVKELLDKHLPKKGK